MIPKKPMVALIKGKIIMSVAFLLEIAVYYLLIILVDCFACITNDQIDIRGSNQVIKIGIQEILLCLNDWFQNKLK